VSLVLAVAVVFGVNLLPAFAPPTWSVLVLFTLHTRIDPVALVCAGAASAAAGRCVLALATRFVRTRLSLRRIENLVAVRDAVMRNRARAIGGLVIFLVSPVPSAQLFEAAGLLDLSLPPLAAVFLIGRVVSYSIYVGGARAIRQTDFGRVLESSLRNPWAIALEVVMLAGLFALVRVDWAARFARKREGGSSSV
jgi:hypothetical protein